MLPPMSSNPMVLSSDQAARSHGDRDLRFALSKVATNQAYTIWIDWWIIWLWYVMVFLQREVSEQGCVVSNLFGTPRGKQLCPAMFSHHS